MCRGLRAAVRVCSAAAWQARGRRGPRRARCSGWPVSIRVRGTAGRGARCGKGIMGSAGNTHARPLQYSAAAPRRHTRSPELSARHAALRRDHDSPYSVRRRRTRPEYALRKDTSLTTSPAIGGQSTIHIELFPHNRHNIG
ncbi:unnamed protein product [Arctia plantaginis]|uniref:Uncharacterized protein n=1 Tax=Arctia plantaginis TaxID=874455 RepID=A0A8S1BK58_ARCPL|nr:unnamed protein product [Arctia plantaginis]